MSDAVAAYEVVESEMSDAMHHGGERVYKNYTIL